MKAIVDCNSFYCSCERVFRPELAERPVVVLSNNDGCIISRTDEAKTLGVGMAGPYFIAKPIIEANNVEVFSSNYNLYGDMSWRVMETLKELFGKENVEVYSVDEAFVDLQGFSLEQLQSIAGNIKKTVEKWTGVMVSVGVAPTKTLSKLANSIAKKNKKASDGVTLLIDEIAVIDALQTTPVKYLWGVGTRFAEKLNEFGIYTGWDLRNQSEDWVRKNLGGVVGVRLLRELKGEESIFMDEELANKKMIATTRMFGEPVTHVNDIKEAIATYTTRAAEKLRRQHSAASVISAFVVPKEERKERDRFRHGPTLRASIVLLQPTSVTNELIKPAVKIAEQLYKEGKQYKKAGVMLSGLVPDNSIQGNMFAPGRGAGRFLMEMMDNINFSMRNDVVKFASSGTKRNWKMRQEFHSPKYTTRWHELYEVS
jgi:DNA polymerase V